MKIIWDVCIMCSIPRDCPLMAKLDHFFLPWGLGFQNEGQTYNIISFILHEDILKIQFGLHLHTFEIDLISKPNSYFCILLIVCNVS